MATIEYTASPILPCGIPKLKRAKLEELAIDQMRQVIDLQNELMAVKNVAHRTAYKLAERDSLIASYQKARADAVSCDVELTEAVIAIESMKAEDYGGITPERAWQIHQTLIRAATANAEERNAVATQLGEALLAMRNISLVVFDGQATREQPYRVYETIRAHLHPVLSAHAPREASNSVLDGSPPPNKAIDSVHDPAATPPEVQT